MLQTLRALENSVYFRRVVMQRNPRRQPLNRLSLMSRQLPERAQVLAERPSHLT